MMHNHIGRCIDSYLKYISDSAGRQMGGDSLLRRRSAICSFFGSSDGSMMSMAAIGAQQGVSREAVRQGIEEFCKFVRDSPSLTAEVEALRKIDVDPFLYSVDEIEPFSVSSALLKYRALKYIVGDRTLWEKRVGGKIFIVSRGSIDIKDIQSQCIKKISHNGAVRVQDVAQKVFGKSVVDEAVGLICALMQLKSPDSRIVESETGTYLYYVSSGRNRLLNRLSKVFSYYREVSLSSLRMALMRDLLRRDAHGTVVPPDCVICDQITHVLKGDIEGDLCNVQTAPSDAISGNTYEEEIARFIQRQSPVDGKRSARERQIERAVKLAPRDDYGFAMAINHSPLVIRVRRGVYEMTGVPRGA